MNRIRVTEPRAGGGDPASACRDPDVIAGYLCDASGRRGEASALFRPADEAAVSRVLADASAAGEPITVVAGQTSTTAASVPAGGSLLSTEKLTGVLDIDVSARRARAQAGVRLGDFQRVIEQRSFFYPPDPTSRDDCTLGGSLACNASGARSFLYGATRRWVEGLRVVLASGEVLDLARGQVRARAGQHFEIERRDASVTRIPVPHHRLPLTSKHAGGYAAGTPELDLVDLFIGSEGTLGVVSEVEVAMLPLPEQVVALFAFFDDEGAGLSLVERARDEGRGQGGVRPRCLEWLDCAALDLIRTHMPDFALPGGAICGVYCEQECAAAEEAALLERWHTLLGECGALLDEPSGVLVAREASACERMRAARHAVPVGVNERAARAGMPKLGTDLVVPDAALHEMLALYRRAADDPLGLLSAEERRALLSELGVDSDSRAALPKRLAAVTFGHIGDNHLHVNFLPESAAGLALARAVYRHLTRRAVALGGSPSAEHGIGKIKREALGEWLGEAGIAGMRAVKLALDPAGCLGRGNLFTL